MRSFLLLAMVWCSFISATQGQTIPSKKLIKKANTVFYLAKTGYETMKPKLLVKAAKILMTYPQIGRLHEVNAIDATEPSKEEAILEIYDFFDAQKLLADAKNMTPFDNQRLRKKIKALEAKMPKYITMGNGQNKSNIKVKNYLVYGNNSKTITTKFNKNKKVTLSVRIGEKLQLVVFDNTLNKKVGKSQYLGDARLVRFTSKSNGDYFITIENQSQRPNDCFLMIETK